jgi:hypothetical protein
VAEVPGGKRALVALAEPPRLFPVSPGACRGVPDGARGAQPTTYLRRRRSRSGLFNGGGAERAVHAGKWSSG